VPPAIVLVALGLGLVEVALSLGGGGYAGGAAAVGWRVGLIERVGLSPVAWDYLAQRGFADPGLLLRLVAYPVVHGGAVHALFAGAMLLALGKFVAEAMGQGRALLVLLASTVLGAAAYGALLDGTYPLYGAYPAIYGLIGAYTYLLWVRIGQAGGNQLGAFRLIGVLLALQLVFGALFGSNPTWVAEVAGFLAGGLAAVVAAPGSLAALQARLRAR
jgi:membrane associated rhomboid family serine protease